MNHVSIGNLVLPVSNWDPRQRGGDEEIRYIDISSVDRDTKELGAVTVMRAVDAPSRARQLVKAGDVLVSTVRPNLNGIAVVPDQIDGATASTGFTVLRPVGARVDHRYLFNWLRSPAFVADMVKLAAGANYPAVSDKIVKESLIPLPPLPEQKRIAAILDKADAIRKKRKKAIELTETFLRSAFLEMFGDPVANPNGWPLRKIGDVLDESRGGTRCGPFGTALQKSEYVTVGVPVWGIDNVHPNRFVESGSLFIEGRKFDELTAYAIEPGDILISRAGTVGRMCVARPVKTPSIIGTNLIRVSLDSRKMLPEFMTALFTFFAGRLAKLRANGKEDAYSFMKTSVLREVTVPVPLVAKQRRYVQLCSKVVESARRQEEMLRVQGTLFNALSHRAFRGEL